MVIVDLGLGVGDPLKLIGEIKRVFSLPIVAFTNHTDTHRLDQAKALGCEMVVPNSQFSSEMVDVVGNALKIHAKNQ